MVKAHDEMQRYPNLLFDEATEHCAALCKCLLKHCSSSIAQVVTSDNIKRHGLNGRRRLTHWQLHWYCRFDLKPLLPSICSWGKTSRSETTLPGWRCRWLAWWNFCLLKDSTYRNSGDHVPFVPCGWSVAYLQVQWGEMCNCYEQPS